MYKRQEIDKIAEEGIREGAYPGCQVVVLKDGRETVSYTHLATLRGLFMKYVEKQTAAGKKVTSRMEGRVVVKE